MTLLLEIASRRVFSKFAISASSWKCNPSVPLLFFFRFTSDLVDESRRIIKMCEQFRCNRYVVPDGKKACLFSFFFFEGGKLFFSAHTIGGAVGI